MQDIINQILFFFKDLSFEEETHRYYVKGKPLKESVSKVIKKLCKKTDFKSIAQAIDKRDNLPPGTTGQFWSNNSKVSTSIGHKAHFFGEIYAFHRNIKPTDGLEEAIVKFWKELPEHIIPVFTELKMYHKKYLFGGMKDITLFNTKTGKFIIADYKTNKTLFKNHDGKKMLPPFDDFLDNAFNHYQVQFSLYQMQFEQTGFKVERRILIHIKKDGTYDMYDTEDLTTRLNDWLKTTYI